MTWSDVIFEFCMSVVQGAGHLFGWLLSLSVLFGMWLLAGVVFG